MITKIIAALTLSAFMAGAAEAKTDSWKSAPIVGAEDIAYHCDFDGERVTFLLTSTREMFWRAFMIADKVKRLKVRSRNGTRVKLVETNAQEDTGYIVIDGLKASWTTLDVESSQKTGTCQVVKP